MNTSDSGLTYMNVCHVVVTEVASTRVKTQLLIQTETLCLLDTTEMIDMPMSSGRCIYQNWNWSKVHSFTFNCMEPYFPELSVLFSVWTNEYGEWFKCSYCGQYWLNVWCCFRSDWQAETRDGYHLPSSSMIGAERDEDLVQRQSYDSRQSDANDFSDRSTQQLTRTQAERIDVPADRQSVAV